MEKIKENNQTDCQNRTLSVAPEARDWSRLLHGFTHDLKSPLGAVRVAIDSLRDSMPILSQAYEEAVKHGLIHQKDHNASRVGLVRNATVPNMTQCMEMIFNRMEQVCAFVDQFTLQPLDSMPVLSAKASVQKVMESYPFESDDERTRVQVRITHDFFFRAPEVFIQALFYNWIENALYAMNEAKRGQLTITTKPGPTGFYVLSFKDTGTGIVKDLLPFVFNRFFSMQEGQVKPGLGFCRHVIRHLGGEIVCLSEEAIFTEFELILPVVSDPSQPQSSTPKQ